MTWEYVLIGMVLGMIIGTVAMRFGTRKLRQQQTLQHELKKSQVELDEYREKLTGHCARGAELLDNMADDCRQLCQHMAKGSNSLLPDQCREDYPFRYRMPEAESDNDQIPAEMQPRDYSESASGLLRKTRGLCK
ncbi:MAG: Z-ring associated protein ZapG [Sodalis sp. (in: enterobacteria)]